MKLSRALLGAVIAAWAGPASACEHLTAHFELCAEGTPWADGVWENGGDSATLHLGDAGYDGFEDYTSRDTSRPIARDLRRAVAGSRDGIVARHGTDGFSTDTLQVVRSINTVEYKSIPRERRVLMIGEAGGERLLMVVRSPSDTPLDEVDRLSRAWAGLVRPKPVQDGN